MNKSEAIRSLRREGLAVAEIARRVGVRYQFARNVLLAAGMLGESQSTDKHSGTVDAAKLPSTEPHRTKRSGAAKPHLTSETLVEAGFEYSSRWVLSPEGELKLDRPLPKSRGVYGMAESDRVVYVGLATMGLAKRFYFYGRPGATQRTSQRVNKLLKAALQTTPFIDIYTATPPDLEWNGLPVSGVAGLELGLIEAYLLPWNIRGARP